MLTTILGGFLVGFALIWYWPLLLNRYGGKGGFLAAMLLVGLGWLVNHGGPVPLIHQTGPVFVDMGLAVGIASLVANLLQGKSTQQTLILGLTALVGGGLAGVLLVLF